MEVEADEEEERSAASSVRMMLRACVEKKGSCEKPIS